MHNVLDAPFHENRGTFNENEGTIYENRGTIYKNEGTIYKNGESWILAVMAPHSKQDTVTSL